MNTTRLSVFLWKELKEFTRDRKALLVTLLLPPLALSAIGLVTVLLLTQRQVFISIVNVDEESEIALNVTSRLYNELSKAGYNVSETHDLKSVLRDPSIDLIVVIPRGFTNNVTSLDRVAFIEVIKRAGISSEQVDVAENTVRSIISTISTEISELKISTLAEKAGISTYSVEAVRNPVQVKVPVYIGVHGEPAKIEDIWRPFIAKLLILSFSFVVTPASSYVIDGIIGERERKTMEMLLASPLGLTEFLIVKVLAASIVGLIAAISDLMGLYVYVAVLMAAVGGFILGVLEPGLILLHAVISFLTILTTTSISLPFISRTRGIKSASSVASLISTLGLAFFVAGWIIDFYKLPSTLLKILLVVPYTHSILAIQAYVYRDQLVVAGCTLVLLVLSTILVFISTRTLDREKVLLAHTYYT